MSTLRQSIEAGERGHFVTRLYEAYQALRIAGNKVNRAYMLADAANREKMILSLPECIGEDGEPDHLFLVHRLEKQYPALTHLDDEVHNPHQFVF